MEQLNKKILIVDDNQLITESLKMFLISKGFEVFGVFDGNSSLAVIKQKKLDLIILDLGLPDISGFKILEKVVLESPQLPVIILSGTEVIEDVIKAMRIGAWDFVQKPVKNMQILYHIIFNVLEKADIKRENELYLKRLEKHSKAAKNIQFQLLPPKTMSFDNVEFSSHLVPCMHTTGDFLDYFLISKEYLGFYFADVSGHGVSSSFITVFIKSFFDRLCKRYSENNDKLLLNPAKVLNLFNQEIIGKKLEKFLTIFFAVIDLNDNYLISANAGQYPFPVFTNNDEIQQLKSCGLPLGIFEFSVYENLTTVLPAHFKMLLLSDGFIQLIYELNEKNNTSYDIHSKDFYHFILSENLRTAEEVLNYLQKKHLLELSKGLKDDVSVMYIKS